MKQIATNLNMLCSLFTALVVIHMLGTGYLAYQVADKNAPMAAVIFILGLASALDFWFVIVLARCVAAIGLHLSVDVRPVVKDRPAPIRPLRRTTTNPFPAEDVPDDIPDEWLK